MNLDDKAFKQACEQHSTTNPTVLQIQQAFYELLEEYDEEGNRRPTN